MNQKWYWAIPISLFLFFNSYSEVTIDLNKNSDNKSINIKWNNNSLNSYYLGGCRFFTNSYTYQFNTTYWNYSNIDKSGMKEHTLLFANATSPVQEVAATNGSFSVSSNTDYSGKEVEIPFNASILLKTGSSGMIEQPEDEDPITIDQIDSLLNTPNFYNPDHRYIDTLGSNGGIYSGGIMDTWLGETQVITHFSDKTWPLHTSEQGSFDLSKTGGDPIYWMTVIMGQEYFQVDMQWMLGKGAQETGAGASAYNGTNKEGAFGPWEVETGTGKSRESAYPYLFQNGTIPEFWDTIPNPYAEIDEAYVVNGYIYSIAAVRYMYDFLMYAEDACWKEILTNSKSRYYPLSILLGGYNNGISDMQYVLHDFWHVNTYEPFSQDPNGHNVVEAAMNKGYVPGVIGGVENLENGSKAAANDLSLPLIDMDLSLNDLRRFFYGDGGSATTQGIGGLLAHFDVNRSEFNDLIEAAFNKLKGNAPSTNGKEAISLRYDFLTLLRVVKTNFQITWTRPNGPSEWNIAVTNHSKTGGCSGVTFDNEYPYAELAAPVTGGNGSDYHVEVHAWDNIEIDKVTWTINPNWQTWHNASHKSGSGADQTFEFDVTEAQKNAIDSIQTIPFWYLATDINGNSVLGKGILEGSKYPELKEASAIDTSGDGLADFINVKIQKSVHSEAYDLDECDQFTYSWPTKSSHQTVTDSTILGDSAINIENLNDNNGAGLGEVLINYQDMSSPATTDILDKVGPAIQKGNADYKVDSKGDTLKLKFTELLNTISGTEYFLAFKNSTIDSETVEIKGVNGAGQDWNFIFDNLALSKYEYVKIVSKSSLTDTASNQAADNNQWVQINPLGTNDPTMNIAYVKDTTGNGNADQLTIKINKGDGSNPITMNDVKEVKYTWPNGSTTQSVTSFSVKDETTLVIDIPETAGYGKGTLDLLDFGSSKILNSTINDSVGPAITTAFYKELINEPCSLKIVFCEPITDNLQDNTAYLNIKKTDGSKSQVTSSKAIQVGSDGLTWIFVLPANSIDDGDSVNLISNSGLIDQAYPGDDENNKPHPENKMVIIEFESDLYDLDINNSAFWDNNANGIMDKVTLTFKGKSITESALDNMSFLIEWPDKDGKIITMVAEGKDFTLSGQTITWNVSGYDLQPDLTIVTDSSNYGGVTMIQPVDDSTGSLDTSDQYTGLKDEMAPVIVTADYYINNTGDGVDSLFVTFSEEITQNIASLKPFVFNDNEYELELVSPLGQWVTSKSITFTNVGSTFPESGDSLNINIDAKIKGNVEQGNSENKYVKLNVYLEITVKRVEYYDTDSRPDGRIDLIKVITDTTISEELLNKLADKVTLPVDRKFYSISSSDFSVLSDGKGFSIDVSQDLPYDNQGWSMVSTSVSSSDTISISEKVAQGKFMFRPSTYLATDSLAPVITKGFLKPAFIDENNYLNDVADTVMITFSESVNDINNDEPFNFIISGVSVSMTLLNDGLSSISNTYNFVITDNKDQVIMENDSVQIDDNGEVSDINGNMQSKNTYPVPFTIGDYKYAYKLLVYPNPLLRSSEKQLQDKKDAFDKLGIPEEHATKNTIAVMVRPYGYVLNSNDIQTKITIYDMVGNKLVNNQKLEFQQTDNKQIWYYIWDTMNYKKRLVGNGAYLGQVNMKNKTGQEDNFPIRIGVGE